MHLKIKNTHLSSTWTKYSVLLELNAMTLQKGSEFVKAPVIDLINLRCFKLLGTIVIDVPVDVKTKNFSKLSQKKIKASGEACALAT